MARRVVPTVLGALALVVVLGVLTRDNRVLGIDRAAFDVIDTLRSDTGLDVVRFLTDAGSWPVAFLVAAAGAIVAVQRGLPVTAVVLIVGMVVLWLLVGAGKDYFERPRPADRFYDPNGYSYPSGHAAYATVYVAAAMATGRRGLIALGVLMLVAVAASRLYLHVHYLTDVVGGAALGAVVFAAVGARR